VMITVKKAGTTNIVATAGGLCGQSALTVTAATADDWTVGSARYNDGVVLTIGRGGMTAQSDAGTDAASAQQAACTNCHGDTANGPYKTVQHTPEQTGGFSDADLQNIFRHGTVPQGGYFDTSIVSYATWQSFHNWEMTDDQAKGIIVYLRSLTPAAQTGAANFGNRPDGGFTPPDGGGFGGGAGGRSGGRGGNAGGLGGNTGAGGQGGATVSGTGGDVGGGGGAGGA
jgi:cytochrome c553